jgi:hypothetical protein
MDAAANQVGRAGAPQRECASRPPQRGPGSGSALVAVMEPADLRNDDDPATWWGFDGPGLGTVVVERLVWPRGVVIGAVAAQESAEMGLAQDEEMIEALA